MKPCAKHRQPLALMAVGALDEHEAQSLRSHLEGCPGCREYVAQMERVTERLRAATAAPQDEHNLYLHRRVRQKIMTPRREIFQWRLVASTAAVAVVLLLTMPRARHQSVVPPPGRPATVDSDVTIFNYESLANQSLDKLDRTLTEQGSRSLPSSPVYRAGSFAAGNSMDNLGI